jgi:hypothetical protein
MCTFNKFIYINVLEKTFEKVSDQWLDCEVVTFGSCFRIHWVALIKISFIR